MASGFFFGGMAPGILAGADAISNDMKLQSLLQLQVARDQSNHKHADYMKLRSDLIDHIGKTTTALKNGHKDWTDLQVASNPAVVALKNMLQTFDKNLKLPDTADSIIAGLVAGPSQIQTEAALARAKEGPQHQALVQSEINKNNALAGTNPDSPGPGQGLGSGRVAQAFDAINDASGPSAEDAVKQKYDARTLFKAEQYLAGNTSVLTGLGYGRQGASARKQIQDAAADLAIARGISPGQVNAEIAQFMGQKRAASQAGMRVGNVTVAMDAAQAASKRVLETSDKVNRTQYPSINSVLLAAQKGTGDPAVVQYGIAVNTLVNNYARAVGGGNAQLTDAARQEAIENLNVAWSKGQIRAAVEQINKEIASELSGAQKAMKDVTSGQKEDPLGIR